MGRKIFVLGLCLTFTALYAPTSEAIPVTGELEPHYYCGIEEFPELNASDKKESAPAKNEKAVMSSTQEIPSVIPAIPITVGSSKPIETCPHSPGEICTCDMSLILKTSGTDDNGTCRISGCDRGSSGAEKDVDRKDKRQAASAGDGSVVVYTQAVLSETSLTVNSPGDNPDPPPPRTA